MKFFGTSFSSELNELETISGYPIEECLGGISGNYIHVPNDSLFVDITRNSVLQTSFSNEGQHTNRTCIRKNTGFKCVADEVGNYYDQSICNSVNLNTPELITQHSNILWPLDDGVDHNTGLRSELIQKCEGDTLTEHSVNCHLCDGIDLTDTLCNYDENWKTNEFVVDMFTSTCAKNEWGLGYPKHTNDDLEDKGYINLRFNGCVKNSCEAIDTYNSGIYDYGCGYEQIAKCEDSSNGTELQDPNTQQECVDISGIWIEKKCWSDDDTSTRQEYLIDTENGTRSYTYRERQDCINDMNGIWSF